MGLDISVVSNLNFVCSRDELSDEECDQHHDDYVFLFAHPDFEAQADEMETGFYTGEYEEGFRAGSYGGYSRFREELCKAMLDVDPVEVWNNPNRFNGIPFVELINFSDCEGTIGPQTSAKLYWDFKEHLEKAEKLFTSDYDGYDYLLETYKNFMNAFEIAGSKNGAVQFH